MSIITIPCQSTPYPQCDLICNGDFECPVISPSNYEKDISNIDSPCWKQHHGGTIHYINDPSGSQSGDQYIEVSYQGINEIYQQLNVLVNNTQVTITFWRKNKLGYLYDLYVILTNSLILTDPTLVNQLYHYEKDAFGNAIYTWVQHTITYTFVTAGTYYLVFNDPNPSHTYGNLIDNVSVQLTPPSITLGSNSPVYVGDTINLTCTSPTAVSYAWTGPNSFSSVLQNPIITHATSFNQGLYGCTVTDGNGCTNFTKIQVIVSQKTFIITDCDGVQTPFITTDDLSAYVGQTVRTCINTTPLVRSFTPTNCIVVEACCNSQYTLYIPIPPTDILTQLQLGQSISFSSYPGICFRLNNATPISCLGGINIGVDWNDVTTFTLFTDCPQCVATQVNDGYPACALPSEFYLLTNCCDSADQYVAGTNYVFFQYEGFTVQIPSLLGVKKCWKVAKLPYGSGGVPSIAFNAPDPHVDPNFVLVVTCPPDVNSPCSCFPVWDDGCYCATVEQCFDSQTCLPGYPWPGEIFASYNSCEICKCKSYVLHDCAGILADQYINNDFLTYSGSVIKLVDCPDICWEVSGPFDCDGTEVCVGQVLSTYQTCLLCSPVIPIPPEPLRPRAVKPGYDTPGCSIQYTEQVKCNYSEAVYSQMIRVRYGLTMCCVEDIQKWYIKNQELELRAIYDPDACKTICP